MKTLQRTLTIVKPDAVKKNAVGDIIEQFEKNDFRILAMKMLEISKHQAEQFYAVHASRSFFSSLTDFMSSGPIVALALEKENAIADLRKLMGATNPGERRRRHDPKEMGHKHRAQCHSRLRCGGYGAIRVELLLRGIRADSVNSFCPLVLSKRADPPPGIAGLRSDCKPGETRPAGTPAPGHHPSGS